jgi:DNA modification methylase
LTMRLTRTDSPDHDKHPQSKPTKYEQLTIKHRPITSLTLDPHNPRLHSEEQIEQIAKSIRAFGFNVPVLIDNQSNVIAGHGRVLASKLAGMTEVPTIALAHLSLPQVRAFMIADNRLTENSVWDERLLAEQIKSLSEIELDFPLEVTGFEVGEIDFMIEGITPATEAASDSADESPEPDPTIQVSKLSDLWLLGRNRVFCGNCLDAKSYSLLMEGKRASMVFTDPPFNVRIDGHATGLGAIHHKNFRMASGEMSEAEFTDFLAHAFALFVQHSVNGAMHFAFMDWRHLPEILAAGKQAYTELKALCVWVKDNGGMGSLYRSRHELCLVFKNGQDRHRNNVQLGQFGRYRTNVWEYPGVNSFSRSTEEGNLLAFHPTVKPVALVADAIMDCSARGDIVLDPFLGSGTTVIAAERTGRICYGMEIDPLYVDTIVRRWQRFTGLSATHAVSGKRFDELEKEVASE